MKSLRLANVLCAAFVLCLLFAGYIPLAFLNAEETEKPQFTSEQIEFFEAKVRPLLIKRCYECHGPEADELEGGFSLASRDDAIKGGDTGAAIIPGNAKKSLLVDAINYGELYEMPPESKMPADEIELLNRWVEMGAPWTPGETSARAKKEFDLKQRKAEHWAWQPVKKLDPPVVQNNEWPLEDFDRFVMEKLEGDSLAPAPAADRRTLIRRVCFDLIGLPPTTAQVDAFVHDNSDNAFEKVVDHLLAAPQFGERWARHWMDLMRYAETGGHEFDYEIPHAWRYRDYLIRAFNADVPFDDFVREHIAGDLLPEPRLHPEEKYNESLIATGFWFLHEAKHSPVDVRLEEAGYFDNRIDVLSKTFLGMTIACARCHDHKFDAIATKDYYGLAGILQSSRRQWGMLDPHGKIHQSAGLIRKLRLDGDAMREALCQERFVKSNNDLRVADYLQTATELIIASKKEPKEKAIADKAAELKLDQARLSKWISLLSDEAIREPEHPLFPWYWAVLKDRRFIPQRIAELREKKADKAQDADQPQLPIVLEDFSSVDASGLPAGWFVTGEAFQSAQTDSANRAAWNPHSENILATTVSQTARSGLSSNRLQGVLRSPTFELKSNVIHYRMAGKNIEVRVIIDGYDMFTFNALLFRGVGFKFDSKGKFAWHRQAGDIAKFKGHRAHLEFIDHGDGWIVIDQIVMSDDNGPPQTKRFAPWLESRSIESSVDLAGCYEDLIYAADEKTSAIQSDLQSTLIAADLAGETAQLKTGLAKLKSEIENHASSIGNPIHVQAITEGTPEDEYVFIRGNPKTLGVPAPRRLLEALDEDVAENGASYGGSNSSGRLELAEKIVSADNPLTSRVIVNRLWHHMTGRGIVSSTDNFGVLGQRPTHPELLDYLASDFMENDWSIKSMLKKIAMSSTYQMSSAATDAEAETKDPENLLLHRMRVKRLQGEAIRDSILQLSGRLDKKMYGPGVAPFLTPFMEGRGRPKSGPLDGAGRRSIYLQVRRNFLLPMMLAFDTPQPFSSVGRRNQSNVPAQALILMNDQFVIGQAELWAKEVLKAGTKDDADRVRLLYQQAFAREPTDAELKMALEFIGTAADGSPNKKVETWRDLSHVMINLKEFIYVR